MTAPDQWGETMSPPYNRPLRHGKMTIASMVAVFVVLVGAAGGLGWVVCTLYMSVSSAIEQTS